MKNIHILPTDKPSRLFKHNDTFFLNEQFDESSPKIIAQNIYITSDEEIKEGDWIKWGEAIYKANKKYTPPFKKIILTTDQELIEYGVQAIDDEFLQWFINNPSCESVEVDKNWNYPLDKSWEYKLRIIPKEEPKQLTDLEIAIKLEEIQREEPKQETIREVVKRYYEDNIDESNIPREHYEWEIQDLMIGFAYQWQQEQDQYVYLNGYIDGSRSQAKFMYNDEEVLKFTQTMIMLYKFGNTNIEQMDLLKETLEQFKNDKDYETRNA